METSPMWMEGGKILAYMLGTFGNRAGGFFIVPAVIRDLGFLQSSPNDRCNLMPFRTSKGYRVSILAEAPYHHYSVYLKSSFT